MLRRSLTVGLLAWSSAVAGAADIKGRVAMPDSCSPLVSPAVVTLDPVDPQAPAATPAGEPAVALTVKQQGLQFEPRVQVARVGQPIKFENNDGEQHNVHSATPGVSFSWSMAPKTSQKYTPTRPGLIRLVCDVHTHMRGFVVVAGSPWAQLCRPAGEFQLAGVPAGRYVLNVWHEMGQPYRADVTVGDGELDLGTIALEGAAPRAVAGAAAPVVAWPEVIDRISVLLSEARAVVAKPDGYARARKLAEDAYWGEFELSDMETAVRRHLGVDRAGVIEEQLRGYRAAIKAVHEKQAEPAQLRGKIAKLLVELNRASADLKRLNIFDRRDVGKGAGAAAVAAAPAPTEQARQVDALAASFARIRELADAGQGGEAASAMTDAYFTDFEPLERMLNIRSPQAVAPLEAQFNALRGQVDAGLSGTELAGKLDGLRFAVVQAVADANTAVAGSFGSAFGASLVIILREGVEVILLLAMLIALATKAGRPRAMAAIWWGIGAAVVASGVTAYGLNLLVAASQGRTRELVEGAVMMSAAAILFYVSYWLISQTQARLWADFLKQHAASGAKVGGVGTLAATSFLAVYREGAETTLMYQAMISGQGGSRDGLVGVAAGLVVGLVALAVVAAVLRASSVRLPIRPFFKVSGFALFAMAVVFAGNGVFELQNAGLIKVTPVAWIGLGCPILGVHPNVQTLVIQGFLLCGAALTLVQPLLDRPSQPPAPPAPIPVAPARVGVGV